MKIMAKKRPKQWVWSPLARTSHPALSPALKARVDAKARQFVEEVLKPRHIEAPPEGTDFNYVTDVILKWHGSSLFFIKVFACPGPNALSPSFESRFARMRHAGNGRFDLAFMRYTGQWIEIHQGMTIEECLDAIRDDPWFQA
jgi:hypothetical protein